MEVILTKDVKSLGHVGDVVKVKDGYARNLLFPRKLAFPATPTNLKRIEQEKKKREALFASEKKEAEALAEKLSSVSCTVNVEVNDQEKLYGTIKDVDVVKALEVEGYNIDRRQVMIDKPIEELGIYDVEIDLHPEVKAKVRLWVTKK